MFISIVGFYCLKNVKFFRHLKRICDTCQYKNTHHVFISITTVMKIVAFCVFSLFVSSSFSTTIPSAWIDEGVAWLQEAITIDSSSIPMPGNEWNFVDFLTGILTTEGITYNVHTLTIPGTPITMPLLVATLSGSSGKYSMLLSHSDTVETSSMPIDMALSGEIVNGYIEGRGSVDMKFKTIYDLCTMVFTKRLNLQLEKGLMMAVFPAEELGLLGSMLAASDPLIAPIFEDVELALGELGGTTVDVMGKTVMPVAFGEKGGCWITATVTSELVHSTVYAPVNSLATFKLAGVLQSVYKLGAVNNPVYSDLVDTTLEELENIVPPSQKHIITKLKTAWTFPLGTLQMMSRYMNAASFLLPQMTRIYQCVKLDSFYSPTMIPATATALFSALVFPGDTCQAAIDELKSRVNDNSVVIERYIPPGMSPEFADVVVGGSTQDIDDPALSAMYDVISAKVASEMPQVSTVHAIGTALSDCTMLKGILGMPCIGFTPLKLDSWDTMLTLAHSDHEKIPYESFKTGLAVFFHIMEEYST